MKIKGLKKEKVKSIPLPDLDRGLMTDGRAMYYYKNGKPIIGSKEEPAYMIWGKLFEDKKYHRIKEDKCLFGLVWVSTVWLGTDHDFSMMGPPIIFESMSFCRVPNFSRFHCSEIGDYPYTAIRRYSTVSGALRGHKRIVKRWNSVVGFFLFVKHIVRDHFRQ